MARPGCLVGFAALGLVLAATVPLLVNAVATYQATATAARVGLTYGARLPLDWLAAGVVVGVLSFGAVAGFARHRSAARWLFAVAAVATLAASWSSLRPTRSVQAVAGLCVAVLAIIVFAVVDRRADGARHRSWLTERRLRIRGMAAGLGGMLLGIGVGLAEDERILGPSRLLRRAAVAFAVTNGLFALLCLAAMLIAWAAAQRRSGRGVLGITAVTAGALSLMLAAFATYSLGFHWKATARLCSYGHPSGSLAKRRADTEAGTRRAESVFGFLPELVGFRVRTACADARRELELIEQGECPLHLIDGMSCRCGDQRVPDDVRCEHAQCARYDVPKLRCAIGVH